MSIKELVGCLLPHAPETIHNIVMRYCEVFFLGDAECIIQYDFTNKLYYKIRNINTGQIGIIFDAGERSHTAAHSLGGTSEHVKKFCETNFLSNIPVAFEKQKHLHDYIMSLKKEDASHKFVVWLNPGEKFNLINTPPKYQIIRESDQMCISPSTEIYRIVCQAKPMALYRYDSHDRYRTKNEYIVYYDKLNNIVLNEDRTKFAVLLSIDFGEEWAAKSKANIFDTAKILQILPGKKMSPSLLVHYQKSPMKSLRVKWIPVDTNFVIYTNFFKGDRYEFVDEFKFVA